MSHQELKLEIPCDRSCPQLGVGSGNPNPKKSSDASTAIPEIIVNGRKEITGVKEFGSIWERIIFLSLTPTANDACT